MTAASNDRALLALSGLYLKNHPSEAAQRLEEGDTEEVAMLLEAQPEPVMTALFTHFSSERAESLLPHLSDARTAHLLAAIDHGDSARLLSRLGAEERQHCLDLLPGPLARELHELSSYPPEVAGSVMETRFLALGAEMQVEAALSALRRAAVRPREQVFVVDADGRLAGRVPLADLAVAHPEQTLGAILLPAEIVIGAMAPRDEVAEILSTHRITNLPVLDPEGHLLGVIRQDGLLDAARAEMLAGVQAMVGVSRENERFRGPASQFESGCLGSK